MERLQEQLQQERDRKTALEAGLNMSKGNQPIPEINDEKVSLSSFFSNNLLIFLWLKVTLSNLEDILTVEERSSRRSSGGD